MPPPFSFLSFAALTFFFLVAAVLRLVVLGLRVVAISESPFSFSSFKPMLFAEGYSCQAQEPKQLFQAFLKLATLTIGMQL